MKKIIFIFLAIVLPLNVFAFNINSKNAILYNLNDDSVIYELNPNDKVYIASMTKIMTCLVALEKIDNIDSKITMDASMFKGLAEENASVAGFRVGEDVTYRDLLYGLMLPSGADAALGLAISTYGSVDNFVSAMNKKAKDLNLSNTHFVNPTGLDDKNHFSSVYDVAQILKVALKNSNFKEIFEANKYQTSNKLHTFSATRNKYNFDTSFIDGSKTGFTYDAGLCMASTSHYDGVNYLLVTANASYENKTNHLVDAKKIYEYYFKNYGEFEILKKGDLITSITLPDERVIKIYSDKSIKKYLKKSCNITSEYINKKDILDSHISDIIGEYVIKCDNDILYKKDINLNIEHINTTNNNVLIIIIIIILVIISIIGGIIYNGIFKKRSNKKRIRKNNR